MAVILDIHATEISLFHHLRNVLRPLDWDGHFAKGQLCDAFGEESDSYMLLIECDSSKQFMIKRKIKEFYDSKI